jgi:hypothetical protein
LTGRGELEFAAVAGDGGSFAHVADKIELAVRDAPAHRRVRSIKMIG